ncbi:MAG: hypothetical protein PHF48_08900 [Bacteroidales bacterium]|nr:hypothetical protein [Bacteroidales bacterium]
MHCELQGIKKAGTALKGSSPGGTEHHRAITVSCFQALLREGIKKKKIRFHTMANISKVFDFKQHIENIFILKYP